MEDLGHRDHHRHRDLLRCWGIVGLCLVAPEGLREVRSLR